MVVWLKLELERWLIFNQLEMPELLWYNIEEGIQSFKDVVVGVGLSCDLHSYPQTVFHGNFQKTLLTKVWRNALLRGEPVQV